MAYEYPAGEDARIDLAALLAAVVRRLPRILLVTAGLLVATFVVLMLVPRHYESAAGILVEPRTNAYVRASNEQAAPAAASDVGVVSSQIELIKSRDTLLKVIDELDLRSVPEFNGGMAGYSPLGMIVQVIGGRQSTPTSIDETVLNTLYELLTVVQERDSRMISVIVRSVDPQRAADIANAVANAHVARRAALSISDTADASGWLLDEINRLRASVQQAEAAVADFKVNNNLFVGQNNTSLLDQQLSTISTQINTAQERKNTALSRAALIRDLITRGQSIEGVPDVRNSLVIQQLSQEKARLQGEQAQRSATLLANHPSIRSLTAQISELENQIRIEGRRVAAALEAEAQIESDLEASLQAELARAKSEASTATRDTVTLDGLQREAKAQRDLLEAYLLRYNEASSRVDSNSALPDVRVVSVAAPSVTPASPKTSLILLAVGLVSFTLQVGLVLFGELMSGRALAPVPRRDLSKVWKDDSETDAETGWSYEDDGEQGQDAVSEQLDEPRRADPVVPPIRREPVAETVKAELPRAPLTSGPLPSGDDIVDEPVLARPVAPELPPQRPAPAAAATGQRRASARSNVAGLVRYHDLVSDLVMGRTHLLLLADQGDGQPSREFAEELAADALERGLSVALIDAGTGHRTEVPGLTDLSIGDASFGDVVQKSTDNSFAEVGWGRSVALDRRSVRPLTLVEALGDIYEVVLILTGRPDGRSTLDIFAGLEGRVLVVAAEGGDIAEAEATRHYLLENGMGRVEISSLSEPVAA